MEVGCELVEAGEGCEWGVSGVWVGCESRYECEWSVSGNVPFC